MWRQCDLKALFYLWLPTPTPTRSSTATCARKSSRFLANWYRVLPSVESIRTTTQPGLGIFAESFERTMTRLISPPHSGPDRIEGFYESAMAARALSDRIQERFPF